MFFGRKLKDRFYSLQVDWTNSVLNVSSSTSQPSSLVSNSPKSPEYRPKKVNLHAGDELLKHYQNEWEELRLNNEQNARLGDSCDNLIGNLNEEFEKRWNETSTLQMLVSQIPKINEDIKKIMNKLGDLEALFSDVEISLLALEDTIDAGAMQKKQLEQRFQTAMYQERKKMEYNETADRLHSNYLKKKQEVELKLMLHSSREKCSHLSNSSSDNLLKVPKNPDNDHSLETVDLNEEESALEAKEDERNQLELSAHKDILDDVSPLPKDGSSTTSDDEKSEQARITFD